MDLAGQRGVVQVGDEGTTRPPKAGNRGDPNPASRPPLIQDQLSPWGARGGGRWAAGAGARAMAGGSARLRRAAGSRRRGRARTEPELGRAAGGGRAEARRSGPGRGRCGDRAAGKCPGGGRAAAEPRPSPVSALLAPPARGSRRGVRARRGLRRSLSAGRCGDVRRRRDRAAPRARQSRPYTDTKCLRGKLQARDAGGGRRGGDRQPDGGGGGAPTPSRRAQRAQPGVHLLKIQGRAEGRVLSRQHGGCVRRKKGGTPFLTTLRSQVPGWPHYTLDSHQNAVRSEMDGG